MKRLLLALTAIALTTACGITEDEYAEEFINIFCDLAEECYDEITLTALGFSTADECVDLYSDLGEDTGGEDTCEFDSDAAQTCLDEYSALTCDDLNAGTTPSACALVCG